MSFLRLSRIAIFGLAKQKCLYNVPLQVAAVLYTDVNVINPRWACAGRVTVVGVCVSVCPRLFWHYTLWAAYAAASEQLHSGDIIYGVKISE